jgi:hypothetical protein
MVKNKAQELVEVLKDEPVPSAMASLSLTLTWLALDSGLSRNDFLYGVAVCYDVTKAQMDANEDKTCH